MLNAACDEIRLELPLFARSGLEPSRAGAVTEHLSGCDACRAELAELERLEAVLEAHLPVMTPSPAFASVFANRLAAEVLAEEEAASRGGLLGWVRPWLVPLAIGAALAGVMVQQVLVKGPAGTPVASLEEPPSVAMEAEPPATGKAPRETAKEERGSAVASAEAPPEVLDRLELFVDYAVIENLEVLDTSGHAG